MASYILVGSLSIVQVLSPKVVSEMVEATIQTVPTGIIAARLVTQGAFDSGAAGAVLADFADAIETVIGNGKAIGGSGTSSLDASGLQTYYVTFEVAYNPPGAPEGTVTVDVDVPVSQLVTHTAGEEGIPRVAAEAAIDAAYNNLVALAGG